MNGICLIWSRGRLISPSLPVGDDRYLKSRGKSFGPTLWHHVQRYCCLGVLFAHAQVPSNSSSYHICGNDMNWVRSSEYMIVFTSFTRASFVNMRLDQSSSWLITTSFLKSTILPYYSLVSFKYLDLFKNDFFALLKSKIMYNGYRK